VKILIAFAAWLAVTTSAVFAQQPAFFDPLLDRFAGNWVLQGTIAGKTTTHGVAAEWVPGHQYLRFHEISREKNDKGQAQYEANVYIGWIQPDGEYGCAWLDTWGGVTAQSLARARREGDSIPFVFKDKDGSLFRTTFICDRGADSWEWRMDAEQNGTTKPFTRVKLVRK